MSPVVSRSSDGVPVIAYALADADGRMLSVRNERTAFYAASTVKLGVMLAAVLASERGELRLDDTLECRRRFVSAPSPAPSHTPSPAPSPAVLPVQGSAEADGAGATFVLDPDDVDPEFPADGGRASVAELVTMMICRSSNEATNVLVDRLGTPAIAEAFRLCGATRTRMERRIGDEAAVRAGLTNETTAEDLVLVMSGILAGRITTTSNAEWMRDVLTAQQHVRIGAAVPTGTPWGSKSGDVPGIEHDVAFVGEGASRRLLAVCTRGYEPEQGREAIRALAQALLG